MLKAIQYRIPRLTFVINIDIHHVVSIANYIKNYEIEQFVTGPRDFGFVNQNGPRSLCKWPARPRTKTALLFGPRGFATGPEVVAYDS